jgi:ankyrin repeat protein
MAFHYACDRDNPETAEYLFKSMCENNVESINARTKKFKTPLKKAAAKGHAKLMQQLVTRFPDILTSFEEQADPSGMTALHEAASHGHKEAVDVLLNAGADSKKKSHPFSLTALQECYKSWALDISADREGALVVLIDHDCEAAANDAELFSTAASKGSTFIVQKLLDAGADINRTDEYGWTPLQIARQHGRATTIKLLEERKAEKRKRPSALSLAINTEDMLRISGSGLVLEHFGECKHCPTLLLRMTRLKFTS